MKSPKEIVQGMLDNDAFSQLLGMEIKALELGFCQLSCPVSNQTTNGFQIAHGGLTYSLADSALAFAHLAKVQLGDTLMATCSEIHRGKTTGVYEVRIENQDQKVVAYFKGTVYISEQRW